MRRFREKSIVPATAGQIDCEKISGVKTAHVVRSTPLICRTARTRSDLTSAFQLLHQRYVQAGLDDSTRDGNGMRILPYHLNGDSQVFIAESAGEVVGTATLILGKQTLPAKSTFPEAISKLERQHSGTIGEVTSLAIDSTRVSHADVFAQLSRLLMFFARAQGIEQLVVVVHPRHAKFYQRAMGSTIISDCARCETVGGKPGVALSGPTDDCSKYRAYWREHFFEGVVSPGELSHSPIKTADRLYFRKLLSNLPTALTA